MMIMVVVDDEKVEEEVQTLGLGRCQWSCRKSNQKDL